MKIKTYAGKNYSNGLGEPNDILDLKETFKEVALSWIAEQSTMLKPTSINRYTFLLERHIIPQIGGLAIQQINNERIKEFIDDMSKSGRIDNEGGLSNSTINDMLILIKSILSYAETNYNIIINIGKFRVTHKQQAKNRFYSTADINALITTAWERYNLNNSDLRCLGVLLCIYTGIRISELCALRWEDINLKRSVLFINSSLQRIKKENYDKKTTVVLGTPKTEKSVRVIPIKSIILEKLYAIQPLYTKNDFLLSGKADKAIEPRNMQYYFKQIQIDAGIEPLCFHSLRHTFASTCIQSGMDIKTLSEILGHSSVNITLSYYVHSSMEQKLKQIEAIEY